MRRIALLLAVLLFGCEEALPMRDAGTSVPVGSAAWDDTWRTFTAKQSIPTGQTCAQRPSEWTVDLDSREVRYSGCFFNRTMSGTHVLSPSQFQTLRAALRALVTSDAQCLADSTSFEVRVETSSGEQVLEECGPVGTRVAGFADVFRLLRSVVPEPVWNESITYLSATSRVVFGSFCPGGSDSNWLVDLTTGDFSYDACTSARARGRRTLNATERSDLRTALEGLRRSTRTFCGADKHELTITIPATGAVWADDFYGCRTDWNATFVEGMDPVFDALRSMSHEAPVEDAGIDAGPYPTGPAWPSSAQRVEVDYWRSYLSPFSTCALPDGGLTNHSTWSLDLDSGVIDYAVCYAQEHLYVVDSGVLSPAQLAAFTAAATTLEYVPWMSPPCSNDGEIDRFTVTTDASPLVLNQSGDYCPVQPIGFRVQSTQNPRTVLEAATHP